MDEDAILSAWRTRRASEVRAAVERAQAATGAVPMSNEAFDRYLAENPIVMVDFWARWCGPCRAMAPVVEELAKEWAGRIAVAKVDTDAFPDLAQRYRVQGIPAFLFFKDGQVVGRIVGMQPKDAFEEVARELLPPA